MKNKQAAIKVIKQLNNNGFEALLAGGCVRDLLAARLPKDYDVATDARPDDIRPHPDKPVKVFCDRPRIGSSLPADVWLIAKKDRSPRVALQQSQSGISYPPVHGRNP